MRIPGSVVLLATKIMMPGNAKILQIRTIRWQFVCDESTSDKALIFQRFAHQLERFLLVSTLLNPADADIRNLLNTSSRST